MEGLVKRLNPNKDVGRSNRSITYPEETALWSALTGDSEPHTPASPLKTIPQADLTLRLQRLYKYPHPPGAMGETTKTLIDQEKNAIIGELRSRELRQSPWVKAFQDMDAQQEIQGPPKPYRKQESGGK